jgi:hypothetical protein
MIDLPYRVPCPPDAPPRPRLRRFKAVRTIDPSLSYLLSASSFLLVAMWVAQVGTVAIRAGFRMPSGEIGLHPPDARGATP